MSNIIRNGIILGIYLFAIITLYIFISSPFDDIITNFEDINSTGSDSHVDYHAGYIRSVFDISFAIAALIPSIWFIASVFSREPDWGIR